MCSPAWKAGILRLCSHPGRSRGACFLLRLRVTGDPGPSGPFFDVARRIGIGVSGMAALHADEVCLRLPVIGAELI